MKLRIHYDSRLVPGSKSAWVLFPFIFFRECREDVGDRLFRHEMQHIYQVLRYGWFGFYGRYLWYLWRDGYNRHPFELEAYERQNDELTTVERFFKDEHGSATTRH